MRVLLVTSAFPPYNSLGAVRVGKFARFLTERGHEVRGLAAENLPLMRTLPQDLDLEKITFTPWLDINFLPNLVFGGKNKVAQQGYSTQSSSLKRLGTLYRDLLHFPDDMVGWYPRAVPAGKRLIREWKPDLIYASAMPFTSLMVASTLSRWSGVPWVGELRDLWADHAYYVYGEWRRKPEDWLERRTLRSAIGLVTVTLPWAERLSAKYHKPVAVIPNGYDLRDYPAPDELVHTPPGCLRIVYTGAVYPNYDLGPLFEALHLLGWTREQVQLDFYCRYIGGVMQAAEKYGITGLVEHRGLVSFREALKAQLEADILYLLLWNDPKEHGVVAAKIFEYIGSRRPILATGYDQDVASLLVRERGAGFVSSNPVAIASQLQDWMDQKTRLSRIPDLPVEARVGLSRDDQYQKLEQYLVELLALKAS